MAVQGAGQLRERITVQVGTETNTRGTVTVAYATHATLWARAERMGRGELNEARKINTKDQVTFTTRYLSTVTTKMRILWASQTWDVHAIRPTERRDYMELDVSEVT